jgi:predicted nucleic acid-binding protein
VKPLFLDTAFLIALEAKDDQHHLAAQAYWRRHRPQLVTTVFILTETVTFFNRRHHHAKAVEIGEYLLASPSVDLYHIDDDLFQEGWRLFQRYDDKRFSLTDCLSFAVMQRLKLTTALTFDHHFAQAGFTCKPS